MKWANESLSLEDLCGDSQNFGAKMKYLELCQTFMDILNRDEL